MLYSEIFNIGRIGNLRPGPEIEQENVCFPYYKIQNDKILLIFMYLSFSFSYLIKNEHVASILMF